MGPAIAVVGQFLAELRSSIEEAKASSIQVWVATLLIRILALRAEGFGCQR
jgi:hypothetical protein